ncbi:UNVERIFIED_CONTAM: hypothetical protein ITH57_25530, partial [Salmonella enterica subsp. enterica serovar Weltevreden]
KQAPRAWYDRLTEFLIGNKFTKGKADPTLLTLREKSNLFIVKIYVDDIIFVSTNETLCWNFSSLMTSEFKMPMMGELS